MEGRGARALLDIILQVSLLLFVSAAGINYPDEKQLRERGFILAHTSRLPPITVRKSL